MLTKGLVFENHRRAIQRQGMSRDSYDNNNNFKNIYTKNES